MCLHVYCTCTVRVCVCVCVCVCVRACVHACVTPGRKTQTQNFGFYFHQYHPNIMYSRDLGTIGGAISPALKWFIEKKFPMSAERQPLRCFRRQENTEVKAKIVFILQTLHMSRVVRTLSRARAEPKLLLVP